MIGHYSPEEYVVFIDDDEAVAPARIVTRGEIAAMDARIRAAVTGGSFGDALVSYDDENDPHLHKQTEGRPMADAGQLVDKVLKHFDDALKLHCDSLNKRMDSLESRFKRRRGDENGEGLEEREEGELERERKEDGDLTLKHEGKDEDEPPEEKLEKEQARKVAYDSKADAESASGAANAQWRVQMDEVLSGLGQETPKVLAGESTRSYQQRILKSLRKYSPKFREVDLGGLNAVAFKAISEAIMADVAEAAKRGPDVPEEAGIVEVKKRDPTTGRLFSTFYGKRTFIHAMKRPAQHVRSFWPHGGSTAA
jgi:hypothetical protein